MAGREDSIEIDVASLRATGEQSVRLLERFAGYEILGRLAIAGSAELLVARERSVAGRGRLLTLKVMRPRFAADPARSLAFTRDARVALRLKHPNLCEAYRAGVEDGLPFVALELVHGLRVRDLIERAGERGDVLVPSIAVAIAVQVADAMHAGHVARARAGDLRPGPRDDIGADDVMVALDGSVKLLATPRDAETDVFALGLLLHEMLTGRRPSRRMLDARPRAWPRAVPARLARVLDHALSDDDDDRYPSAAAMRDDLERFLGEEPTTAGPSRIAEAVLALSESGDRGRPAAGRNAFVPLRGGDATGTHALPRRAARWPRVLVALLLAAMAVIAISLASSGVAL